MTALQYYEYSFIALICLGLLIHNYINIKNYGHRTPAVRFLLLCVLALICGSVLEIIFGLREAGIFNFGIVFSYTEEILYTLVTLYTGYFWFIYSELYQKSPLTATKKVWNLVSIPLLIMAVVTLLTPWHHLVFYFQDGHYVRGPLTIVFALVMYIFIIDTGVTALIKSFMKRYYLERSYLRIIFAYAVILIFFQGIQLIVGSVLPFRTIGAALVIYIVQQKYIKENVYTDSLTGANNRTAVGKYLSNRIGDTETNLQIAVIDIDKFKGINDTYGHGAGDRALQLLVNAFKTNLTGDTFFARYGGDEFLMINTAEDTDEPAKIAENARLTLQELCRREDLGFALDFSCGIIRKTPEMTTIPDIIEAADKEMYRIKKAKKAARE